LLRLAHCLVSRLLGFSHGTIAGLLGTFRCLFRAVLGILLQELSRGNTTLPWRRIAALARGKATGAG
jgi:hypothetical protein